MAILLCFWLTIRNLTKVELNFEQIDIGSTTNLFFWDDWYILMGRNEFMASKL